MQIRSPLPTRLVDGAAQLVSRALTLADRSGPAAQRPVVPQIAVDPATLPYFRRELFPAAGPVPWLDRPDAAERIEEELAAGRLSIAAARIAHSWVRDGFVILPKFFARDRIDGAWAAYEAALAAGTLTPRAHNANATDSFPERTLDPHLRLPAFADILHDPEMLAVVGMLMGAQPVPFQTIAGHKGSEQREHSDTIHMTTYPLGYLVANWIACEDIDAESGPLVYYPGSHRLPYLTSADLDIPVRECGSGRADYSDYHAKYEPAVAKAIADHGLEPAYFTPQAGDVLLWHANLIHGGAPRRDSERSRKAVVCHYFAAGCLTYHDYTATPTRLTLAKLQNRKRLRNAAVDVGLGLLERSLRSWR